MNLALVGLVSLVIQWHSDVNSYMRSQSSSMIPTTAHYVFLCFSSTYIYLLISPIAVPWVGSNLKMSITWSLTGCLEDAHSCNTILLFLVVWQTQ